MIDQTQVCPSSISPLGMFQGIIYVIFRGKKGGPWCPELLGGPKLERRPDLKGELQTSLHNMGRRGTRETWV